MTDKTSRYNVTTWDIDLQEYTPQAGMKQPAANITLDQLRPALEELRTMGYTAHRTRDDSDPFVLVERIDDQATNGGAK